MLAFVKITRIRKVLPLCDRNDSPEELRLMVLEHNIYIPRHGNKDHNGYHFCFIRDAYLN